MAASVRAVMERVLVNQTARMNLIAAVDPVTANRTTSAAAHMAATLKLISSLVFAESKSVRTSTIILAAFNVLAAFGTAASILYDCYWASKRCNPKFRASKFCISSIHPAETFPLVISIGIIVQGIVFAAVQGQGLKSLFTDGCEVISQFMWPALFIVPYIQVVFGIECAIRSLRPSPFQSRGKYDVTICCGVVLGMLIVTWIPSHVFPEPDHCFASLVWFATRYGELAAILLAATGGFMILSALTIFYRLSTVKLIDQHQRITASRMVYYLVVGIVSLAFVLPYFFSLISRQGDIKLAMMATVVLNLSGLMSGLLQLFLRSNTATTSLGPKSERSWDRRKHDIRIFGPNELAIHHQLQNPLTRPFTPTTSKDAGRSRSSSQVSLTGSEKWEAIRIESLSMNSLSSPKRSEEITMPAKPDPTTPKTPVRGHVHKPSYSLFPADSSPKAPQQQPLSIYDISDLEPPPVLHNTKGIRHRQDSSVVSSATVQIGLRLSHSPFAHLSSPSSSENKKPPLPAPPLPSPLPLTPTTYNPSPTTSLSSSASDTQPPSLAPLMPQALQLAPTTYNSKPESLSESPVLISNSTPSPPPTLQPATYIKSQTPLSRSVLPPPPLRVDTSMRAPLLSTRSPKHPSPGTKVPGFSDSTKSAGIVNSRTLPHTPKAFLLLRDNTQLSPAVYSPEKKTSVTPAVPHAPLSATLPKRTPLGANPFGSPSPLARSDSDAQLSISRARERKAKGDWI